MLQEINNKEEKQLSTDICCEPKNNFDELKMFQVHKHGGDSQSRSLVFKISRIANKSVSTSDSVKENKSIMCFEKPELKAGSMNTTSSSEAKIPHSTAVTDEKVASQRSDFIKGNKNKLVSFYYGSTCFQKSDLVENSMSASLSEVKISHSTAVKDEKNKCCDHSNPVKGNKLESFSYESTCFEEFNLKINNMCTSSLATKNPNSTAIKDEKVESCERSNTGKEDKNKLLSFDYEPVCFQKSNLKVTSSSVQNKILHSTADKRKEIKGCELSDPANKDTNKLLSLDYELASFKMADIKNNMTTNPPEVIKLNSTAFKDEKIKGSEQSDFVKGNKDDLQSSDYGSKCFEKSDLKENIVSASLPELKIYCSAIKVEKNKSYERSDHVKENKNKLLSFDYEPTCFEKPDIKDENITTDTSASMNPNFTAIKHENMKGCERRRSLRLIELQSKIDSSQSSENNKHETSRELISKRRNSTRRIKQEDQTSGSENNKHETSRELISKRRNSTRRIKQEDQTSENENTSKVNKRGRKRKPSTSSLSSTEKKFKMSDYSQNLSKLYIDPSKMRLKGMMLIPSPRKPSSSLADGTVPERYDDIYLKFANVDTPRVLSNLNQQENISKSLASQKAVSLFFPREFNVQMMKPDQNVFSPNETSACQYNFKKAKFDLLYLCKKYHMLDFSTLDRCYGLSNCSVRKTEIMLSDIISGKEVILTKNQAEQHFSHNLAHSGICFNDSNSHFYMPFIDGEESVFGESFEKGLWDGDSDSLCHKIIVQSMEILYCEEAVS